MADGSSYALPFDKELVVDLFAGGGGASMGIGRAYREPDIAVNHNPIAVAVHRANHPNTRHFTEDVFDVDPLEVTGGRPVGLLWASPDCRHHSKAKGGAPRSKRVRGLAWIVVRWALACTPRQITLENVEEFVDWCPLDDAGNPLKERRGETFRAFIAVMTTGLAADHPAMAEIVEFLGDTVHLPTLVRGLGYSADWREIRACDHGSPTIRKRLYVKFRRDGRPITWAQHTHARGGAGGLKPWRAAAECIDFSLPAKSIFGRRKPLADNTCRRVAKGLWRYVLDSERPYIVPPKIKEGLHADRVLGWEAAPTLVDRGGRPGGEGNGRGAVYPLGGPSCDGRASLLEGQSRRDVRAGRDDGGADPGSLAGLAGGSAHALGAFLTEHANASNQRCFPVDEPLRTQVAQVKGGHFSLVTACMIAAGHDEGRTGRFSPHALMQAHFLEQANGGFYDGDGRSVDAPMSTICTAGANQRLVSAYLVKYYGTGGQWQAMDEPMHTIPTRDRMGLVMAAKVRADLLPADQLAGARRCAEFLHKYLPEQFPEAVDAVMVGDYVITDITLRMLVPAELARAQGFHDGYIIDRGLFETAPGSGVYEWRPISKTDQVRLIGNSVCPDVAEAEVRNDLADLIDLYGRIAA